MADQFTAEKLAWLEQVVLDGELSPLARVIATILALKYLNRETGDAWPAIETLAADAGLKSTNPVRAALRSLEAGGHLNITWSTGGKGQTSRFRPVLKEPKPFTTQKGNEAEPFTEVKGNDPEPFTAQKGIEPEPFTAEKGMDSKPFTAVNPSPDDFDPNPSPSSAKPFTAVKGNPIEEPTEETREGDIYPAARSDSGKSDAKDDPDFASFWTIYPLKVGRGAARLAFEKARMSVPVEIIFAGARRYAAERLNEDSRFTKHAKNWLGAEGWADEARPANDASYPASAGSRPMSMQDRTLRKLGFLP